MAEQVKAADAPAPALSFGNFADKVASPSGGFNFKAPEFNTGNQGLFGAPTKFGETDKKEGEEHKCGLLKKSLYGTRDAGAIWEDTYRGALEDMGFLSGTASPVSYTHLTLPTILLV